MTPTSGFSRRGFLGAAGTGAAVLSLAGGWLWLDSRDETYRRMLDGAEPVALSVAELAILAALAAAIVAPGAKGPTAHDTQVARRLDRELWFHPGSQLLSDVRQSLALIERLPVIQMAGTRFTALSPDARETILRSCERSAWKLQRRALAGLKYLILFIHYSDDRTWPSVGYAGPLVTEKPFEGGNRIANLAPVKSGPREGDHQ